MIEQRILTVEQERRSQRIASDTSAAATAATVSIAAPGAGKRLHLTCVIASYSDGSAGGITVTITQGGDDQTLKLVTPLVALGMDLIADENTGITVAAAAGGSGVTSDVAAIYYTEEIDP